MKKRVLFLFFFLVATTKCSLFLFLLHSFFLKKKTNHDRENSLFCFDGERGWRARMERARMETG